MFKNFRKCAGAIVFNKEGKVLLCSRNDVSGNHWQFPQGGIEVGEKPQEAAQRELFEETSISSVELIYVEDTALRYEFTEQIKNNFRKKGIISDGQDIYFSLFFFTGQEDEINVCTTTPEFKDFIWETMDFAIENIISFKKEVYTEIAKKFTPLIAQYLSTHS